MRTSALLLLATLLASGDGWADDWDERLSAAENNRSSPEGVEYETAFGKTFATVYGPWLNQCAEKGAPMGEDFDLLLQIDAEGRVQDTRRKPETAMSRCLAVLAKAQAFPIPPRSPYWWLAAIRFSSKR